MTVIDVGSHVKAVKITLVSYCTMQPPRMIQKLKDESFPEN